MCSGPILVNKQQVLSLFVKTGFRNNSTFFSYIVYYYILLYTFCTSCTICSIVTLSLGFSNQHLWTISHTFSGHFSGFGNRYPPITASAASTFVIPGYGIDPRENISHTNTPNANTSDWNVYLPNFNVSTHQVSLSNCSLNCTWTTPFDWMKVFIWFIVTVLSFHNFGHSKIRNLGIIRNYLVSIYFDDITTIRTICHQQITQSKISVNNILRMDKCHSFCSV